jgi:hypothetical protein
MEKEIGNIVGAVEKRMKDKDRWIEKAAAHSTEEIGIVRKPAPDRRRIKQPYIKAGVMEKTVSLEALFSNSSKGMIEKDVMKVIETESPVADTVVARRLCDAYGMQKASGRLIDYLTKVMSGMDVNSSIMPWNARIFWNDDQDPSAYAIYRVPPEGEKRNITEIASRELINAIAGALSEGQMEMSVLIACVGGMFGDHEMSEASIDAVAACIGIAANEKTIEKNGRTVTLAAGGAD